MMLSFCITATAAPSNDTAYRNILNSINTEYGLNIGYGSVNADKISVDEYEQLVRQIASEQRELNDMIAERATYPLSNATTLIEPRASKTVTKDVWNYETTFAITATYDVNGTAISNARSISIDRKLGAILNGITYHPSSGPTTQLLDSGRTLSVTYYGTWWTAEVQLHNIKFYTEFYYDS